MFNSTKKVLAKLGLSTLSLFSLSASAGGLSDGTTALNSFISDFYTFVGVGAGLYMIYLCGMAFMEKKTWGDVGVGCGKVAVAGGAVVLAGYCWTIWGS